MCGLCCVGGPTYSRVARVPCAMGVWEGPTSQAGWPGAVYVPEAAFTRTCSFCLCCAPNAPAAVRKAPMLQLLPHNLVTALLLHVRGAPVTCSQQSIAPREMR